MKRGKAPGPDGIINEIMVYKGAGMVQVLVDLLDAEVKGSAAHPIGRKLQ